MNVDKKNMFVFLLNSWSVANCAWCNLCTQDLAYRPNFSRNVCFVSAWSLTETRGLGPTYILVWMMMLTSRIPHCFKYFKHHNHVIMISDGRYMIIWIMSLCSHNFNIHYSPYFSKDIILKILLYRSCKINVSQIKRLWPLCYVICFSIFSDYGWWRKCNGDQLPCCE